MKRFILFIMVICVFSGCYGIQEDYEFTPSAPRNILNKSVWEHIVSDPDSYSMLKRAIDHTGLQALYEQTENEYTYILLRNTAFTLNASDGGILAEAGVEEVEDMDVEELKNILLYHIIRGTYHGLGTIDFDPIYVLTLREGQDGIMTVRMDDNNSIQSYSSILFNDMLGSSERVRASRSNMFATNGVVHDVNKQIVYVP